MFVSVFVCVCLVCDCLTCVRKCMPEKLSHCTTLILKCVELFPFFLQKTINAILEMFSG